MADFYHFLCPHCFFDSWLPKNKTGRYCVKSGVYQMLVDLKEKKFSSLLLPWDCWDDGDNINEKADTIVHNYIKYGYAEYFTKEEAEKEGLTEQQPPRYEIWSNTPKHWKCPICGHKMIMLSPIGMLAD